VLIKNATQNSAENLTKINAKNHEVLINLFDVSGTTNKSDEQQNSFMSQSWLLLILKSLLSSDISESIDSLSHVKIR